jgi:hypothetical protein
MNASSYSSAFVPSIALDDLRSQVPAAFAEQAAGRTSPSYVFISTRELVTALLDAGFATIQARQSGVRSGADGAHARHMLAFQPLREVVTLDDAIPQIVLINSHDGRCAYTLRAGLYRPVCTNGLLTRLGDFGLIHVPHRGNVVRNVVEAALGIVRDFSRVSEVVERMQRTVLGFEERLHFARRALAVRYPGDRHCPVTPASLLAPRRAADEGSDLWRTFNVVSEHLLRGGLTGIARTGRVTRSRGIQAIREDVRINSALWQLAVSLVRV